MMVMIMTLIIIIIIMAVENLIELRISLANFTIFARCTAFYISL
jgi:hypothetical protein